MKRLFVLKRSSDDGEWLRCPRRERKRGTGTDFAGKVVDGNKKGVKD